MGFHEKRIRHQAGKDQGAVADFSGVVTEARAVCGLQMKCGGASSSDGVGGCWGSPLGGGIPPGGAGLDGEPLLSLKLDPSGLFHPRCRQEARATEESNVLACSTNLLRW